MSLFDLPLEKLRDYRSASTEPEDFDQFWADTLAETRGHALNARFEPVATALTTLDIFDVTFAGFGGHPVKGWLVLPARGRPNRCPWWWSSSVTAAGADSRTRICSGPPPGSRIS